MEEKPFEEMTWEEYQAYKEQKQIDYIIKVFEEGMNYGRNN